jgi:hypothetical protein
MYIYVYISKNPLGGRAEWEVSGMLAAAETVDQESCARKEKAVFKDHRVNKNANRNWCFQAITHPSDYQS